MSEPNAELLAALAPYAEKAGRTPEEMLALVTQASEQAIKRAARKAEREAARVAARARLDAELTTLPEMIGASDIASWYGINRAAVSNWLTRYTEWPRPVATGPNGYLWNCDMATRKAWNAWRENKA